MNWPRVAIPALAILLTCGSFPAAAVAQARCGAGEAFDSVEEKCVIVPAHARFRWPAAGSVVVSGCDQGNDANNAGITLALRPGAEIHATESGRVVYAGNELRGFDDVIFIRHAADWVSAYALVGTILVKRGDDIQRGQIIARADQTDSVGQNKLRFELRQHSVSINPLDYLEKADGHRRVENLCGG
jgi:murein DD-endopeptidase MepM/ murein hydrolase activator NlpD